MATEKKETKTATKKPAAKKTTTKKEVKEEKVVEKETKKEENKATITGLSFEGEIILIYLIPLIGFIFALMKDKEVANKLRFHYNQSAAVFITNLAFYALTILIPLLAPIFAICDLVIVVFDIITIVQTAANKVDYYKIPLINDLAVKLFGKIED